MVCCSVCGELQFRRARLCIAFRFGLTMCVHIFICVYRIHSLNVSRCSKMAWKFGDKTGRDDVAGKRREFTRKVVEVVRSRSFLSVEYTTFNNLQNVLSFIKSVALFGNNLLHAGRLNWVLHVSKANNIFTARRSLSFCV